jgi:phage terminase large subunit-like protein
VKQYANDVVGGKVVVCRWVKLACERFLRDLVEGPKRGLYFDWDAAEWGLEFFGHLRLWKGAEYKGEAFVLAPHYQFIVGNVLGWKWGGKDGPRRFRTAYIEMARKGAKSTFAGGMGAYFFVADREPGAEIYTAAVKKEQAKIVWTNIRNLLKESMFAKLVTFFAHNLSIEDMMSKCEPLSSDSKSLDGLDTHYASLDELHAHPNPEVHDLIIDSTGSRSQPLVLIITTAGFDQAGVCYQRREYLTKILKGVVADDSFFGMIFTLDTQRDWPDLKTADEFRQDPTGQKEDDWRNEDVWVKAMPGLCGVTASGKRFGVDRSGDRIPGYMTKIEDVRDKALYAASNPAALNNFLTKRMNVWTQQFTRWISLDLWDANYTREVYCYE